MRVIPRALASRNWSYFTSAVTKVSHPAAAASASMEPQEPPPTATRRTGFPPSAKRTPAAWSFSFTKAAYSPAERLLLAETFPTRPMP